MLHETAALGFGSGAGYQAADLPYDGNDLAMTVIVPDSLSDFEAALTANSLAAVIAGLAPASVALTLPKFNYTASLDLSAALKALGMTDAFDSTADFSGIDGARDLYISAVLHKGFVGIDEAGTEAAAATAVVIDPDGETEPVTFTVAKPFLFVIRDKPTGAILFVGRVVDPS